MKSAVDRLRMDATRLVVTPCPAMMSEDNVEIPRRGFAATMDADWPTALATPHPDAEIHDFDIPDGGI